MFAALLIKTDSGGNVLWTRQFDGAFKDVIELNDGGLVAVGLSYVNSSGDSDIILIKTDALGNTIWTKLIGGNDDEYGNSIYPTADDGFIICGSTYSYGQGSADIYLIKVDSAGDTLWTRTFGNGYSDFGNDVLVTQDNNIIAIGTTHSYGAEEVNIYVIKIDDLGNTIWFSAVEGGTINIGNSICDLNDGNYLINGTTLSSGADYCDGYFVGLNDVGDTIWTQTYGGYEPDEGSDLILSNDGGIFLLGSTESFGSGGPDMYLLKLSSSETGIYADPKDLLPVVELQATSFPNPFNANVSIRYTLPEQSIVKIEIYDLLGRCVESFSTGAREAGEYNLIWNADDMNSGVYFYNINAGKSSQTGKMVLLR